MNTDTNVRLGQIAKIAQNARTSWFGLLALLVFVGVTLMGHEDSDFFAFGAETELPLVNITVPTVSFFIVAPALMAALYVYLHIYLHSLWVALAKCPPRIGNDSLEECVYPTMLCTSALAIRRRLRRETGKPVEGSRAAAIAISVLMVWLLGPIVLGVLWWRSMPYHHEWLTLWATFWLWLVLIAGGDSLFHLFYLMRTGEPYPYGLFRRPLARPRPIISLGLLVVLAMVSWDTTEGGRLLPLVPANLAGAELSHKPGNWLHYDIWLEDWEYQFRHREGLDPAGSDDSWPEDKRAQFQRETRQRWLVLTQSLDSPDLRGADLRGANLRRAFLSGADLRETRLEGADLSLARLEGANLHSARLEGARIVEARLEGVNLFRARLEGADLTLAWLNRANFFETRLEGVNLSWARLQGTNLGGIRLQRVNLNSARLEGTSFAKARLEDVSFAAAMLDGATFIKARLEDVDFRAATLDGASFRRAWMKGVNILGARGLTQPQLDGACGDQHTTLPVGLTIPPCTE